MTTEHTILFLIDRGVNDTRDLGHLDLWIEVLSLQRLVRTERCTVTLTAAGLDRLNELEERVLR